MDQLRLHQRPARRAIQSQSRCRRRKHQNQRDRLRHLSEGILSDGSAHWRGHPRGLVDRRGRADDVDAASRIRPPAGQRRERMAGDLPSPESPPAAVGRPGAHVVGDTLAGRSRGRQAGAEHPESVAATAPTNLCCPDPEASLRESPRSDSGIHPIAACRPPGRTRSWTRAARRACRPAPGRDADQADEQLSINVPGPHSLQS